MSVRFLTGARRDGEQRLLWSRDLRFAHRVSATLENVRTYELDAGIVLIGPSSELTDSGVADVAARTNAPEYGLVTLDPTLPEGERHLVALSSAVQASGLADRIGMAQPSQLVQTKMLDYFFSLKNVHGIAFQPIIELESGTLVEYECLFRPEMP